MNNSLYPPTRKPITEERFVATMAALQTHLQKELPKGKQIIRFVAFPPMSGYRFYDSVHNVESKKIEKEVYLSTESESWAMKRRICVISKSKYDGHAEATQIFTPGNTQGFLKILVSVDPELGLLINLKFMDGESSGPPVPTEGLNKLVYSTHDIEEKKLRQYTCLDGHYVSPGVLLTARKSDPDMKKLYMSFSQLYQDLRKVNLFDELIPLIWKAEQDLRQQKLDFIYDKEQ